MWYHLAGQSGTCIHRLIALSAVSPFAKKATNKCVPLKGVLGMKRFVTEEEKKAGTKVLKDRNILNRKFDIAEQLSTKIIEMIRRDAKFLQILVSFVANLHPVLSMRDNAYLRRPCQFLIG